MLRVLRLLSRLPRDRGGHRDLLERLGVIFRGLRMLWRVYVVLLL